jgi:hypothetical protein
LVTVSRFTIVLCLAVAAGGAAAQTTQASSCGSPAAVLQRYVDAVGGTSALSELKSFAIEARGEEPHTFNASAPAHYKYKFQWQFPNRAAVHWQYLLSPGSGYFDGAHWSNFDGRLSHNNDATPESQLEIRARYPYNDSPQWMMYRVVANPLVVAINKDLYASFTSVSSSAVSCVLQGYGETEWKTERRDQLTFDATSGMLKTWRIQAGLPNQVSYVEFRFADYRPVGRVKIPFMIYFDFYKTTFTVTRVVVNPAITNAEFVPRSN